MKRSVSKMSLTALAVAASLIYLRQLRHEREATKTQTGGALGPLLTGGITGGMARGAGMTSSMTKWASRLIGPPAPEPASMRAPKRKIVELLDLFTFGPSRTFFGKTAKKQRISRPPRKPRRQSLFSTPAVPPSWVWVPPPVPPPDSDPPVDSDDDL